MLLQQQLEKIMRKKKFSKLVSSCQYYCLLGTVHTTSSAGGFDSSPPKKSLIYQISDNGGGLGAGVDCLSFIWQSEQMAMNSR